MKKILITGGAGYVGSHCAIALIKNGYCPIILDNFSNSDPQVIKKLEQITNKKIKFYRMDIKNKAKLKNIFKKHLCNGVIHCAGSKSVSESVENPLFYFDNNIRSTMSLLECMSEQKIFQLIFSSSCTMYNIDEQLPWNESSKVGNTLNPYGTSKYVIERILIDIGKCDPRWKIGISRYFNPISNHPSGLIGDNPHGIPNNLLPYIVQVAKKKLPYLKVYGDNYKTRDGTCIRDYIHVMDLALGHVAILKNIKKIKGVEIYNFGTGKGSTVLEIVRTFEKNTGIKIPIKITNRRKGDVPVSFCSPKKSLQKLSWKATKSINQVMIDIKETIV